MGFLLGAVKGVALGVLYALIATPPFAVVFFHGSWRWLHELLPLVALCSVPAGAGVGLAIIATGAYRKGAAWRAQLGMLGIYALTGLAFFRELKQGLGLALMFAPVFIPLALVATWLAVLWIRRGANSHPGDCADTCRCSE